MKPSKEMEQGFKERMMDKELEEERQNAEESERLRRDYLRRTGRTEMKP